MDFNHKNNCFDSIRHIAALLVLFCHNYALHGLIEPTFFGIQTLGGLAVIIFFSISGFLIIRSYENSVNNYIYLKKRFLRLFPGLIVCSFFLTYIYSAFLGRDNFLTWITSLESIKTFIFYSTTARDELMNVTSNYVTERFEYHAVLNGSLWSLFYEIFDYILVLIIFSIFKKSSKTCLIILIPSIVVQIVLYCYNVPETNLLKSNFTIINNIINEYVYKSTLLSIPFFMGGFIYYNSKFFYKYRFLSLTTSLFLLSISIYNPKLIIFYLISIPLIIIIIGLSFKDILIKGKFDYSYGIYIYAWPIQQFFANIIKLNFIASLLTSIIITVFFAMISWHLIEKRFINKS